MNNNWQTKKLGEVCLIERGGSPRPIDSFITNSPEGINWIKIGDTKNITKYIFETKEKIKPEGVRCSRMVYEGDFILSNSMSFGRPYIMKTTGCIHDGWLVLRPKEKNIDTDFLYYLLGAPLIFKQFDNLAAGSTVRNLNIDLVKSVQIPFPPISAQHRIVKILDEIFEKTAKAKENAERNLQNARELFESYLQSVFANPGDGWKEKKLGEISEIFGGYAFKSGDFQKNGRYQVLRMGNVRPGIVRSDESPVFIEKIDEKILSRSLLKPGDIIITQTGTRKKRDYGYTVSIDKSNYLLNQRLAAIRTSKNLDHQFFLYYSWSDNFRDQFFANETGTVGQGNVGMSAVTDAIIPLPPLPEQQRIVAKLDALSAETKKLEAIYKQKLADLDELKKSVLQKAFNGGLA